MVKHKKAQIVGEVFKYSLVAVFSLVIVIAGYRIANDIKERACNTETTKFEIDLRNIDKSVRFGEKLERSYNAPCKVDNIYFFDLNKNINPENFNDIPIIKDSLKSGGGNNVFLVKEGNVKRSFYAGNLEMAYPYNICFMPKSDKISFFIEGAGKSVKITSACSQPECTFIPMGLTQDEAMGIIKEAIDFGCVNCPANFESEMEKVDLTRQNVEMLRKLSFCDGVAEIQIVLRPKNGLKINDFRFYELIPKTCIDDLEKYLVESIDGDVDIKSDPLVIWHFNELNEEKRVSYKLNELLDDECMQAIKGLGVAQFIEEQNGHGLGPNTAPTIEGLPDRILSGTGLKDKVILNLWKYSYDKETNSKDLAYTITEQTMPGLVDCFISAEKHIHCDVKQDINGASKITVQVDDSELQDSDSFNIEVSKSCRSHAKKECFGKEVFWLDSCGNQEELIKSCKADEECDDEGCEKKCVPNFSKKCEDGIIFWLDSCGESASIYYNCSKNLFQKQCKNAQCCAGAFFCYSP